MAGRIAYYGGIVTDGLVLHLDAAKKDSYSGQGTVWNDISGRRNNGTLVNGPTFDGEGSIVFDGVNDYISFGISRLRPDRDFSYSLWVKTEATADGGHFFTSDGCGDSGGHYGFITNSGQVGFRVIGSTSVIIRTNESGYNNNQWYNVGFTKNSSTMSIYINGQLSISGNTPSGILTVFLNQYLGIRGGTLSNPVGCGTGYYKGRMSNLLVYNKSLTSQEILQNYNATKKRFGL